MITGAVNADYEAVIRLRVYGPAGHEQEVEAILDYFDYNYGQMKKQRFQISYDREIKELSHE